MKAYKLEILIVDHDEVGQDKIIQFIENNTHPDYCLLPEVMRVDSADIGKWHKSHPLHFLNKNKKAEYQKLFGPKP